MEGGNKFRSFLKNKNRNSPLWATKCRLAFIIPHFEKNGLIIQWKKESTEWYY